MPRETKAQRLERESAEHARAVAQSLCWPGEPEPLPYTPDAMRRMLDDQQLGDVVRAYTFNAYSKRVTYGCFNSVNHNTSGDRTTSQGRGGPWFASQREAALALEWAVCRKFAEELLTLRARPLP